jgi:hypothetical protein
MIIFLTYIALSLNLLNIVEKPIEIDSNKDQIFIIISGPSCHVCLQKLNEWTSESDIDVTAVIWYNKTIIEKKSQIKFYKQYISPAVWAFSKDLGTLSDVFNLDASPNVIVRKGGGDYYFRYPDLFTNGTKVTELQKLIDH